jgi:hypothetical protein
LEKSEIIYLVAVIGLMQLIGGIALAWYLGDKIFDARIMLIHNQNKRFKKHQEWLFEQLYSIAPGKVLKPDEVEPVDQSKPATVTHPSRDPMNEFNGTMEDWD